MSKKVGGGLELWSWELTCYCFIFILGFLGNTTVILVVLKSGSRQHRLRQVPFNIYLMSLAIVDLIFAISALPIYVLSTNAVPHPSGLNGDIMCKVVTGYLIPFWLSDVSIYTLVIISFERYFAISKPFLTIKRGVSRKTYLRIAVAYIAGFIVQIPTIVGSRWAGENGTVSYCKYEWPNEAVSTSIYAIVFVSHLIFPAVTFTFNFYRIRKCLAILDTTLRRSIADDKHRLKILKSKQKTVKIMFIVMIAFFCLWAPNHIMYLLFQFGGIHDLEWNSAYYQAAVVLGFCSSWLNPFLYAFQSRDFRSHAYKVLRNIFCGQSSSHPPESSHDTGSSPSSTKSKIGFQKLKNPVN